jgi:hypothetical protein
MGEADDLARATASPRGKPVPNCNEQVAVRHGRPPGHYVAFEMVTAFTRELEDAGRSRQEGVELHPSFLVGHVRSIPIPVEWQHRVQLEAQAQSDLRRDLVCPVS